MSANLHLLFPLHVSRQKGRFFFGGLAYIYILYSYDYIQIQYLLIHTVSKYNTHIYIYNMIILYTDRIYIYVVYIVFML